MWTAVWSCKSVRLEISLTQEEIIIQSENKVLEAELFVSGMVGRVERNEV